MAIHRHYNILFMTSSSDEEGSVSYFETENVSEMQESLYEQVIFQARRLHSTPLKEKDVEGSTLSSTTQFRSLSLQLTLPKVTEFNQFDFDFIRGSSKFSMDIWLYIYYNMMNQGYQLMAASKLSRMGLRLHRRHWVWVRQKKRGGYSYFNVDRWGFNNYSQEWREQDFVNMEEVIKRKRQEVGSFE